MTDKPTFEELVCIIEELPEAEWYAISATDATKDSFLQYHNWNLEEFKESWIKYAK